MSGTAVFIHGAWMPPRCREPFTGFFERRGWRCLAPAWPRHDRPVAADGPEPAQPGPGPALNDGTAR